jgi:chromosome segregation ATPase
MFNMKNRPDNTTGAEDRTLEDAENLEEDIRVALSDILADKVSPMIKELQDIITRLDEELTETKNNLKEAQEARDDFKKENVKLTDRVDSLQDEIHILKEDLSEVRSERDNLQNRVDSLEEDL